MSKHLIFSCRKKWFITLTGGRYLVSYVVQIIRYEAIYMIRLMMIFDHNYSYLWSNIVVNLFMHIASQRTKLKQGPLVVIIPYQYLMYIGLWVIIKYYETGCLPLIFGYRTADLWLRYLSFERAQRQISCSIPMCECLLSLYPKVLFLWW